MKEDLVATMLQQTPVTINPEHVALTGDFRCAIVLDTLISLYHKAMELDRYLEDNPGAPIEKTGGWFTITAGQLIDKCLFLTTKNGVKSKVSESTMLVYINYLLENGWIERRNKPGSYERAYQYAITNKLYEDTGYITQGPGDNEEQGPTITTRRVYDDKDLQRFEDILLNKSKELKKDM